FHAKHRNIELDRFRANWFKEIDAKERIKSATDGAITSKKSERERSFVRNGSLQLGEGEILAKERLAEVRKREFEEMQLQKAEDDLIRFHDEIQPWLPDSARCVPSTDPDEQHHSKSLEGVKFAEALLEKTTEA